MWSQKSIDAAETERVMCPEISGAPSQLQQSVKMGLIRKRSKP